MKKIVWLLLLLLIPINVHALGISRVNVSGQSEIKQGEASTFDVDIHLEGVSLDDLVMIAGAGLQIEYDSSMLVIEDVSAANSEVIITGTQGNREIVGYFNLKEEDISYESNCINNAFCNVYRFKVNAFAKGSGPTIFKIKTAAGIFGDLSNGEEFTADDVKLTELPVDISKDINIIATTPPTNVPTEPITKEEPITPIVPTLPVITTKKPKPTTTTTTTTTMEVTKEKTTEKTTDKFAEEIEKDKEKREKINKKIFFYGGIAIIVIILLVILNFIINKIRNRKLDKALKNL